ncbi:hypothetical protein V6Z12_D04G128600 [Gossypium hirsutum]
MSILENHGCNWWELISFLANEYLSRSRSTAIRAKIGIPDPNSIVPFYANLQLQANKQSHFSIDAQIEKHRSHITFNLHFPNFHRHTQQKSLETRKPRLQMQKLYFDLEHI